MIDLLELRVLILNFVSESINSLVRSVLSKKNGDTRIVETMYNLKMKRLESIIEGSLVKIINSIEVQLLIPY